MLIHNAVPLTSVLYLNICELWEKPENIRFYLSLSVFCLMELETHPPNTAFLSLFTETELKKKYF